MSLIPKKKEETQGLGNSAEQDLENSNQNENSPEFDEIGTALNEI